MRGDEIIAAAGSAELLAEVGCDHAKLTELALMRGVCKRAVVSDISAVCLKKAERTLARFGDKVTYVVADGVPKEAESADCILICGMGGHLVRDILRRYDGEARLVLSPQSHAELGRAEIAESGRRITVDRCIRSAGKYYDIIVAERGHMDAPDEMQAEFGMFWKEPTDALIEKLERMRDNLMQGGERTKARADRIGEVLKWRK